MQGVIISAGMRELFVIIITAGRIPGIVITRMRIRMESVIIMRPAAGLQGMEKVMDDMEDAEDNNRSF